MSVFCVAAVFVLYSVLLSEATLEGPNICPRRETYVVELNETEIQSYTEYENYWCKKWPFRCQKAVTKNKTFIVPRNVTKVRMVPHCCEGYMLNSSENRCLPYCTNSCRNGTCVAPDVCKCEPGFVGETCEICLKCGSPCPQGLYGPKCEHKCLCKNNSTCNSETGECTCSNGWRDSECDTPCGKGFYGLNCEQKCLDQAICDHVTGEDVCRPGYIGFNCGQICAPDTYGQNCTQNCTCKNKAECDNVAGKCLCLSGWKGEDCSTPCPLGTFGIQCEEKCKCSEYGICSPTHGQCKCEPGWIGKYCNEVCIEGYYGDHCIFTCNCTNENFMCDPVQGCVCKEGLTGTNCTLSLATMISVVPDHKNTSSSSISIIIVAGVVVALILLTATVIIVYFYKKKIKNLEDQIYKISYTSRSLNSLDESHDFEENDVRHPNVYATEREKTALLPEAYSSQLYSEQYEQSLQKNRHADSGNPSIQFDFTTKYEEMADLNQNNEHIYDHLHFSRPTSAKKSNYQLIKKDTDIPNST